MKEPANQRSVIPTAISHFGERADGNDASVAKPKLVAVIDVGTGAVLRTITPAGAGDRM